MLLLFSSFIFICWGFSNVFIYLGCSLTLVTPLVNEEKSLAIEWILCDLARQAAQLQFFMQFGNREESVWIPAWLQTETSEKAIGISVTLKPQEISN